MVSLSGGSVKRGHGSYSKHLPNQTNKKLERFILKLPLITGANYFLSQRQFLEAEKVIRIKSLIKHSGLNMSEIKDIMSNVKNVDQEKDSESFIQILKALDENLDVSPSEVDDATSAIVYYVAGYIYQEDCSKNWNVMSAKNLLWKQGAIVSPLCR